MLVTFSTATSTPTRFAGGSSPGPGEPGSGQPRHLQVHRPSWRHLPSSQAVGKQKTVQAAGKQQRGCAGQMGTFWTFVAFMQDAQVFMVQVRRFAVPGIQIEP